MYNTTCFALHTLHTDKIADAINEKLIQLNNSRLGLFGTYISSHNSEVHMLVLDGGLKQAFYLLLVLAVALLYTNKLTTLSEFEFAATEM